MINKKKLSAKEQDILIQLLKVRFEKNMNRHKGMKWELIEKKLQTNADKCWVLLEMEKSGGEPDVVLYDKKTDEYHFYDCASESPVNRRSLCYDRQALEARKEHKPRNSAMDMANEIGVEMLSEEQYRMLQTLGRFDTKTSSWVKTPDEIRKLGGAIFCDCRYNTVFTYHNGAESYYAGRGFRGCLKV